MKKTQPANREQTATPAATAGLPSRETVALLQLATTRIAHAIHDSDQSIVSLMGSFTAMAAALQQIGDTTQQLPAGPVRENLHQQRDMAAQHVQTIIIALQFYDRMTQRLNLTSHILDMAAQILSDPQEAGTPGSWGELQQLIESKYTLDADQPLLNGTAHKAGQKKSGKHRPKKPDPDIELF
ncbi:MAG: hypothetical protein HY940_09490 [Gammaproteobacteria bacterium]|nr:hypothetical protein [Gammaproteobacteria bacterium]